MTTPVHTGEIRAVLASDGVALQHEVAGAGDPIIFLHSSYTGRNSFGRQRRALEPHFRLILRDLRGHNGAEPRVPADYAMDTTEVDDLARVLDAEGIGSAHLVGHSTGGLIAFAFARRYPERVRRLALIEPALLDLLEGDLRASDRALMRKVIATAETEGTTAAGRMLFDYILGTGWDRGVRPATLAQIEAGARMIAHHSRALLAHRVTEEDVAAVQPPILFIHGAASNAIHDQMVRRLRRARPEATFLWVEGAGHAVHVDQPDVVNQALIDFFGGG